MANSRTVADSARTAAESARETAASIAERGKRAVGAAAEQVKEAAHEAGQKADEVTAKVGSGMESLGGTLREHAPASGVLGTVATKVADKLESGGQYLQEEGLSGMASDVTDLIKRHPVTTLMVGIGIGYLIARATRS